MVKRLEPKNYSVPSIDLGKDIFNLRVLEDIIFSTKLEPVNRSTAFLQEIARKMNAIAIICVFERKKAQTPSAALEKQSIKEIANAAEKLATYFPLMQADDTTDGVPGVVDGVVRILDRGIDCEIERRVGSGLTHTNKTDEVFEMFGAATPKDILTVLANVLDLLQSAAAIELQQRSGSERVASSFPDRDFACSLIEVFEGLFDHRSGFSRGHQSNEPQGPLIRFLHECFKSFDKDTEVSSHTLGDWVRFYQKTRGSS